MTDPIQEVEAHLPLAQATLNILLALLEGERHGYGIRKAIEERTGGRIRMRAGTLYDALHRLDDGGLIQEVGTPSREAASTSRWRYYRLTDLGRDVLTAELRRLDEIVRYARSRELALDAES